ncbi:MAG: thioredoxin 1 [Candidatus Westeberhardia cardiocondylae]|nr:thioredoxin 1 [Candidatus Westeberhardia cardiocondylae]
MKNNIIIVNDENFLKKFHYKGLFLIDFWATWCNPCKMMMPILEEISNEFYKKITIAQVNVDENPKTTSKYNIRSVPTLLLFNNGKIIEKKIGYLSKDKLKFFIQNNINNGSIYN